MNDSRVSVEAFDRTAMALVKVIQEDSWIIEGLRKDVAKHAEAARRSWDNYNEAQIELDALKSKVAGLLKMCDERDRLADEHKVSRDDSVINCFDIREVFKP